ncbi:hypothetical protein JXA85_04570 [Candidatus Woesearchaeota archaeon]|nr:hypothetical protein [Candidatus Woesearchaeota archaeon]
MKTIKLIMALVMMLCFSYSAVSLGIAPSSVDVIFEPNGQKDIKLKIVNTDNTDFQAMIYAEGELAKYITINSPVVDFSAGEKEKSVDYHLNLPSDLEKQGITSTDIVIRQIPKAKEGAGTTISTSVAVISKLKVMVPYSGKYIEARLFVSNFKIGKESSFSVELNNLGTEDITDCRISIDILGPANNVLASLMSDEISLAPKQKKLIPVAWTPELNPGAYTAVATVIYPGKSIELREWFTLGEPEIVVQSISVDKFKLGGIGKLDMLLKSNWNLPMKDAYADVKIKDKGTTYAEFKTANTNIEPLGKQILSAFWDTSKVLAGKYNLEAAVHYLDKTTVTTFDIFVEIDKISAMPSGQVIMATEEKKNGIEKTVYILAALVAILIAFNAWMYFKKIRKQN